MFLFRYRWTPHGHQPAMVYLSSCSETRHSFLHQGWMRQSSRRKGFQNQVTESETGSALTVRCHQQRPRTSTYIQRAYICPKQAPEKQFLKVHLISSPVRTWSSSGEKTPTLTEDFSLDSFLFYSECENLIFLKCPRLPLSYVITQRIKKQ